MSPDRSKLFGCYDLKIKAGTYPSRRQPTALREIMTLEGGQANGALGPDTELRAPPDAPQRQLEARTGRLRPNLMTTRAWPRWPGSQQDIVGLGPGRRPGPSRPLRAVFGRRRTGPEDLAGSFSRPSDCRAPSSLRQSSQRGCQIGCPHVTAL